jgi:hypothetical protein
MRRSREDKRRWALDSALRIVGGLVAMGAIIAVVVTVLADSREGDQQTREPRTGVACSFLREAAGAAQAQDIQRFRDEIIRAARAAELALERSGETFGRAERLTLELRGLLDTKRERISGRMGRLLDEAISACSQA